MKSSKQLSQIESLAINVEDSIDSVSKEVDSININTTSDSLDDLTRRVEQIYSKVGLDFPNFEDGNVQKSYVQQSNSDKVKASPSYPDELTNTDIVMSCISGGIAVLVDFMVVKIPKSVNIIRNGKSIHQSGSPLTGLMRRIGFDSDGKTSSWVKLLEKYFKVPYDKSVIAGEKGFAPKSHRVYSLAHDPSPSGLLWAIKDLLTGSTSYIDKDGNLKMISTRNASIASKLCAPIIWIGHIISDIFSRAGIPIPGMCLLRSLQFGSFGEKRRTIGMVVEYMYLEGYDLRHLATMSTANAVIEVILRIYHVLTRENTNPIGIPTAFLEAEKSMYAHRLSKMRLSAYAIASTGNVAKMAKYEWNPLSLNFPIWAEFLRTAILEYQRSYKTDALCIKAVKNRNKINQTFTDLDNRLKQL